MDREGTFLWKSSGGLGQHAVQQSCKGKTVSENKGEGPGGAPEEAKGRSRGRRARPGEGSSCYSWQSPSTRRSVRFREDVRRAETGPGWSGANPGDRAIPEPARGGPGLGTRAPHSWLLPAGYHRARIPRPAASPGPFPPFVKDYSRSFRKRHLR